ncbi:hypothetical protein [Idiomarina aminovorans]|uniref:hypothetical protein n=1 Tax=Idiomarina aminovorans TaxID=2914829 RepID=UPI002006C940|nr:hypothetical protein [Idiomarina sp. ATCH4]MCK7460028.1 hypothetical protein [Idiomarina sp. ATCH4]
MSEFVEHPQKMADHDAWFQQQVQAGIESAKADNLISAVEVEAKFAARRATTQRKLDQPE